MSTPITDPEALGRIVFRTRMAMLKMDDPAIMANWTWLPDDEKKRVMETAQAVRNAVLPEGYVVVPKAEHDAMLNDAKEVVGPPGYDFPVGRDALFRFRHSILMYLTVLEGGGG